jgi:hypothetical protein
MVYSKSGDVNGGGGSFVRTTVTGIGLNPQEALAMKQLIASVVLVVALLTSGAVVTQFSLVGTAYANDGGD